MKKFFAFAACAVLFAGCDFIGSTDDGPIASVSNITISDVQLRRTNQAGAWDDNGGAPDIYVEVQDVSGRAYFKSQTFNDVTEADLPLSLNAQFDVNNSGRDLFVIVLDEDPDRYEVMVSSEGFSADDLAAGGTIELAGSNATLAATVEIAQ